MVLEDRAPNSHYLQGFPLDFFPVLFAVPRVVGWLAHWRQVTIPSRPSLCRVESVNWTFTLLDDASTRRRKNMASTPSIRWTLKERFHTYGTKRGGEGEGS
jgi:hypothetical protein